MGMEKECVLHDMDVYHADGRSETIHCAVDVTPQLPMGRVATILNNGMQQLADEKKRRAAVGNFKMPRMLVYDVTDKIDGTKLYVVLALHKSTMLVTDNEAFWNDTIRCEEQAMGYTATLS